MDRSLDDIIPRGGNRRGGGFRRGGPQRRRGGFGGGSAFGHDDRGAFEHDDRTASSFGHDDRSGGGAFRRNRVVRRNTAPYNRSVGSVDTVWKHDRFAEEEVLEEEGFEGTFDNNEGPRSGIETGTRLQISNLAYSVLSEDLKDLFESIGDLKRATVNFDKSGRSLGTATVVFSRRADALTALKKYNNVPLDDSPMRITLVGTNVSANGARPQFNNTNSLRAAADEALVISVGVPRNRRIVSQGIGRVRRLSTGRTQRIVGRGGRGRGARRSGFGRDKPPTAEELDAEMDAYNQEGNE